MLGLRAAVVTLCAVAVLEATGCAPARRESHAAPLTRRADAVIGLPLVLPVELQGRLDARIRVRLDDGRDAPAEVVWISVTPDPADPGWSWLPSAGRWTSTPADAPSRPSADGFWAAVLQLPVDAVGQGVWLAGQRIDLDWLPDPAIVAPPGEQMLWASPLDPATRSAPMFARLAAPEARDPFRRWRWRLAFHGLAPGSRDAERFDDPVIEALAASLEARWQIGLAWLWREDPALAGAVKRRLVQVVRDGARGGIPAWTSDAPALDALLADLTNPRLDATRRAERARAWLESQPTITAWIVDDAGIRDGSTGDGVPTFGVANLAESPAIAICTWTNAPGPPDIVRVEPASIHRAAIPTADHEHGPRVLRVEAGAAMLELAAAGPILAEPPGLTLAPFFTDWAMPDWIAGSPARTVDTAARLYSEPDDAGGETWMLYFECRLSANTDPTGELVRVWLGPTANPVATIRADADGAARDERSNAIIEGAVITRRADRWTALIPIPPHAIEDDRALRIAVERIDASSRRSCWPRPLLPWQAEPGRALIDLGAWSPRLGGR